MRNEQAALCTACECCETQDLRGNIDSISLDADVLTLSKFKAAQRRVHHRVDDDSFLEDIGVNSIPIPTHKNKAAAYESAHRLLPDLM